LGYDAQMLEHAVAAKSVALGVRRLAVPVDGLVIRSTCRIGVTEVALSDRLLDDLFARADLALYRAKEEGRNRLTWIAPQEA